jgi:hypothetical protein
MVLVNGKQFDVYELDTKDSIITRIAVSMKTTPRYLYFPDGFPDNVHEVDNIRVENLLGLIKENAKTSIKFSDFLDSIRDKLSKDISIEQDVVYVWLAYNTKLEELEKISRIILTQVEEEMVREGYFSSENEFRRFWDDQRGGIKRLVKSAIKNTKKDNERYGDLYRMFDEITDGLVYTDFDTKKVTLQITLDVNDITLLEMFNRIVLTESTPFVTCKDYYKILKDYIPPEEWAESSETEVILKISEKEIISTDKIKEYTNVKVQIDGNIGEEIVTAVMKLNTQKGYLSRDKFIQRFLGVFHGLGDIQYSNMNETEVTGLFFFPQEHIDTYVFSDLVMNNRLFSSLININESAKATKKLSEDGQPWLHLHYDHPSTGHIAASITQQYVKPGNSELEDQDSDIFPDGSPYIRIRVHGKDRKSVEVFQEMFSKLLVIYGNNYNEIVEIYRMYLPDFGDVSDVQVVKKKIKPKTIAPEIFIKTYSRKCKEERMPTIVSDKRAKKYKKKGSQVMVFPRDKPDEGPLYSSDGVNQQNYVCLNPEYPFPGVQQNKKDNKDVFPYVPCCFKTDQNKPGKNYSKYFFGDVSGAKEKKQQDLITTGKFLAPDKYGTLPRQLEILFENIDSSPNYKYIRVGVNRNNSSFLNSVMVALDEQTGILELEDEEEINAALYQARDELASPDVAPLCRQSVYDNTVENIQRNLKNHDEYLDPKLYLQLLEGYFNCNIFLFNKERMILPHHMQNYYKNYNDAPCIFVYEHWGSESDHAKYPQCELIVHWNTKKSTETQFVFPFDQPVSRNVRNIFKMLTESYALDERITETVMPWNDKISIVSQRIDTYGKTRQLNVKYKGNDATIITNPIQPMAVVETPSNAINKVPVKTALKMFRVLGAEILSQTVSNQILKEISGMLGNVKITIPTLDHE